MKQVNEINRDNYELFVVDYLDGNLSTEDKSMLDSFILNNPDIAEELDGLEHVFINKPQSEYTDKESLKKEDIIDSHGITEYNYTEKFIAFHEDDLNSSETNDLQGFLNTNSHLRKEFSLYEQIKLEPDYAISYDSKDSLKKKRTLIAYYVSSAAAVIILLIGWLSLIPDSVIDNRDLVFMSQIDNIEKSYVVIAIDDIFYIENRSISSIGLVITEESEILQRQPQYLTALNSRQFDDEFVSLWDFARIVDQGSNVNTFLVSVEEEIPEVKNKSIFASIVGNQWRKLTDGLSNGRNSPTQPDDPTYVKVIDQSIRVFNTITGSETYTSKSYNAEGELTGYQVEGREVMLSRNSRSGSVE